MTGSIREVGAFARTPDWDAGGASAGPPEDASAAARETRVAAGARYQAFVSNGTTADPCEEYEAPGHDYDRCIKGNVPDPVLFQREGTDVDAVSPRDVQQRGLGDCHVLASLAALAQTPAGRSLIHSAVVENRDDKGAVVSYTVALHAPERHLFGPTTFRAVSVTVDGPYVVGHAEPRSEGGPVEVWPLVVEKACAKYLGGYNKIGHGGIPSDAMTLLTGREATSVSLHRPNRLFGGYEQTDLQADLANGKMVVLSTRADLGDGKSPDATTAKRQATSDSYGLVARHAYFVKGTESRDGKLFLDLGNPWGIKDPSPVPFAELSTWFSDVSVGSVPSP
jgi:Calpain family cysteine protease